MKKYNLILDNTDDENNVPIERVVEYARHRLLANKDDYVEGLTPIEQNKLHTSLSIKGEDEDAVEDDLLDALDNPQMARAIEAHIEGITITLDDAKEIIEMYGEEVTVTKPTFEFLKEYGFGSIESSFLQLNEGVGENDEKNRYNLDTVGSDNCNETLLIVSDDDGSFIVSFFLSGGNGNGWVMRCVAVSAEFSKDGIYHS